ncbi:MAG: hypothetical protein EA396_10815 [Anaerolineaceae bacterium]|nr:MAG: hypothetical protein EA396_10815 [Anaerolineaceae bacterium]
MFRLALSELAELAVAGVTNYDVDALPSALRRGQLPALLVLPLDMDGIRAERRMFGERDGFESASFGDGAGTVIYNVTHLLLTAPLGGAVGRRDTVPYLVDLIDSYFAALANVVTLDGLLLEPAQVRVEPGTYVYGGAEFIGCAFRHRWLLPV